MKYILGTFSALVFIFILFVLSAPPIVPMAYAKPAYAKKENRPCITCHVKAGSKELNDVGKCYKEQPEDQKDLSKCELKK